MVDDTFLYSLAEWRALPQEEQIARIAADAGAALFPSHESDGGKLRVGLWSPVLFEAGAEAWQLALARSLADTVSWRGLAIADGAATSPAMVGRFEGLMPVATGRDACRSLAGQCDVIVSWAMSDVPGLLAGLQRAPKVVSVCHSPIDSEWGMASYRDPAGIDAYVAVSELALGPIREDRRAGARVIWNCVDADRMDVSRDRPTMRKLWGVPDGAKVAGYMGRLSPEKGPLAMPRMLAALPPEWHAVIVGFGRLRDTVEAEGRSLGVSDRLHLVGADHAAGDVLGAFDVLVVPSAYESFCLTLAEGLWAGVPVVSTAVGIASIVPGLTWEVPVNPDGQTLAEVTLAAHRAGPMTGSQSWAREHLSADRFAGEWGEFLRSLALPRSAKLARVNACPARGGELPMSDPVYQRGCCAGPTRWACREGRGSVEGKPTLDDCLACVERGCALCTAS